MGLTRRTADSLALEDLEALFRYWRRLVEREPQRGAPHPRALDPSELPSALLPRVKIVGRETDGGWRYRLVGTAFRDLAGLELSGKRIEEIEAPVYADHLTRLLDATAEERRPVFCEARYLGPGRSVHRTVARLLTPFIRDEAVDTIVIGARWRDRTHDPVTSVSMLAVDSDLPVAIDDDREASA